MRLIATEEAFSIPEIAAEYARLAGRGGDSLDMGLVQQIYGNDGDLRRFQKGLLDIGEERIRSMDENGVDVHLLSLTAPGVQMFDADTAAGLATLANDRLAEAVAKYPTRFAGLGSFAPQDPARAAREIERARNTLKLNGLVVNSHTNDEYYDEEKYFPIFEAAEALDMPIYIHPRSPMAGMAGPFRKYGMEGALWGYGIEVSTHCLTLIFSGLFDRFPKLKIVIGHMGEGIPFWLWRIDYMHRGAMAGGRAPQLKLKPSEYFRRNFAITTSGQENHLALKYSIDTLGPENVLWAIDYPYQPTTAAVQFMRTAPLAEDVKAMVAGGNAAHIFHLD